MRSRIYSRFLDKIRRNELTEEIEADIRNGESILLLRQWEVSLSNPGTWGAITVSAIRPHLKAWLSRRFGEMNFYTTQMLSGHGSFGHFLNRIKRRETAKCNHCAAVDDTTEHTIFECPRWETQRAELYRKLSLNRQENYTLVAIVDKILLRKENWMAFAYFSVTVLKMKEEEERRGETISLSQI